VMAEIASASDQQSQGIDQVTKSVEQMSEITQQNAANSEESAAAALELNNLALEMQKMVDAFELGVLRAQEAMRSNSKKTAIRTAQDKKDRPPFGEKVQKQNGRDRASQVIPFGNDVDILEEF